MAWWGWLIAGLALLGLEMFVIDAQFYLVFIGVSAAIVGLLGLAGIVMPEWTEWLLFAGLSLVTMLAFRRRIYEKIRGAAGHVQQGLNLGDTVTVPATLEPGQTTRIDYRGSIWTARNVGLSALAAGQRAVIAEVDGLTLHIRA
jgi:membrane protein implicated in regulation of membrane protease activity